MRLEQLVLYGPCDDERIRFGPGMTVFGGLTPTERAALIGTVVDALTGRLPNASVVFTDHDDERIYADRTGATYASTGAQAAEPGELMGRDRRVVRDLLVVRAEDLGLGEAATPDDLRSRLAQATHDAEQRRAEHARELALVGQIAADRDALAALDDRLERAEDDAARWAWVELRRRLDAARTELAVHDRPSGEEGDRQLLAAVEELRQIGERWATAAHDASELRLSLGPLPQVTAEDLALVAATPDGLPEQLEADLAAWHEASAARAEAEAALDASRAPAPPPEDPLVRTFAELDQVMLWPIHRELVRATDAYEASVATLDRAETDAELEARIEAAHVEVVRLERKKEVLFRPGMLGSALLAVGALLAGKAISVPLGIVCLVGSVAMAYWLITVPRRLLARAEAAEHEALADADAESWLGLHLRRLDSVEDHAERKRLAQAATERAAAMADWRDLCGDLDPAELTVRAEEVWELLDRRDPSTIARRVAIAEDALAEAAEAERTARAAVAAQLHGYGLAAEGAADLDPEQLSTVLARRVEAGRVARRTERLLLLTAIEDEEGRTLDGLLAKLGFADGDRAERLDRAIRAVTDARERSADDETRRSRRSIEAEIEALAAELEATRQASWHDTPEPDAPPTPPEALEQARRELSERIVEAGRPDVAGAERRLDLAEALVGDLESRLAQLEAGPASIQQRLIRRLGRTTWLGGHDDTVPVILDDALASIPTGERMELLDLLVRLSGRTQVILLTDDPATSTWARDRAARKPVTLFEAHAIAVA